MQRPLSLEFDIPLSCPPFVTPEHVLTAHSFTLRLLLCKLYHTMMVMPSQQQQSHNQPAMNHDNDTIHHDNI